MVLRHNGGKPQTMEDEVESKLGDKITFSVRIKSVTYGDDKTFPEYRIAMWKDGVMVGWEEGPRRLSQVRREVVAAARARIETLRSHRLFAVQITAQNIRDGEARSCYSCAIAQALWCNQDRMGLPRNFYDFRVSPYAAFADADGLEMKRHDGESLFIPPDQLPDIVCGEYQQSMVEWAEYFDEWKECRGIGLREWRQQHGYSDGETPCGVSPGCFVLDIDAFQPQQEEAYC